MPKYRDGGTEIVYTVKESEVEGYTSNGEATAENEYTITNTHKIFDLSLRKYITKVGDTDITNRTPDIDTTDLANGTDTTADYNHRKDAVTVQTGDQVIYNITIYNEGEKDGRATKIVDQLPKGLTYVGLVDDSIFTVETYDIGTNTVYFIRQDSNTDNLDAYNGGDTLDSETIQVICEVTAEAGSEAITLTNVAWISEEYDAEDDITITDQEKADTDSEPATTPEVSQDDLVTTGEDTGYKGDESNPEDLTDEEYYYKGQQDDDDFEKIIIEPITQITVHKTWNDEENQDDIRPETITINLIKDGNIIDTKEMTAESNWKSITFDNLPKYEDGEKIIYNIQEEENTGYAITYSNMTYDDESNTYEVTITNTHTPGTTYVVVNKVWDDEKDRDGIRSDEVIIELLKNGESCDPQQTIKLNKDNKWTGGFYDLPINENGQEIEYTVREITQIEGYTTTIVDDSTGEEISNEIANVDEEETSTVTYAGRSMIRATSSEVEGESTQSTTISNIITKLSEIVTTQENNDISTTSDESIKTITDEEESNIEETNEEEQVEENEEEDTQTQEEDVSKSFTITNTHVVEKEFDLALRKFIAAVSSDETIEESDILMSEDGTSYAREPIVDTSQLNTTDEDGNLITTAIYNHTKEPVSVKVGDYVVYMLRVYNEGEQDGYAAEITDYLPEYLEFVDNDFNAQYGWTVSDDGRIVTTRYLEDSVVAEPQIDEDGNYTLSYVEVPIMCKVSSNAIANEYITNVAEITEYQDENKEPVEDRDSEEDNIEVPEEEDLPGYKEDEIDEDYVPGQEDDDDFEKIYVQEFDLALRKFITAVDDEEVTDRVPEVSYDRETDEITYEHTKDPVEVITGNVVEYTIRVYNEGDIAGYAQEIADDIPDGLQFLPDNETNIEYGWVMYDEDGNVTDNVEDAVEVRTDYLSKEQETTEGENLLQAFNPDEEIGEGNPDYRDIKIVFEVVEPNTSDRILVNSAQITEDADEDGNPIDDIDSIPDEWNEGEDDQDREYVELVYFDLSLKKWVTEAIVIEDGQQTVTQTGHTADTDPEPVVKVEIYRKDINDVTVKFRYKIRVTNEGDIAGYAKEITDYIPDGLTFLAEDNPGWTDEGNNVISTRLLEDTLLQPGESAEVEVVLTWVNGEDNMGTMTNIAEISEDYNDKGAPDIDSTPDNQVWGEDDIDDASVLLSVETGRTKIYMALGLTVLGTLAGGVILIKKYVI